MIALIAIAGLLLVAGGVSWRRRRARRIVPASQVATATKPAALQAGRLERGQQLPPRDEARPAEASVRPGPAAPVAAAAATSHAPMKSPRIRALGYVSAPPEIGLEAEAGPQAQAIEAACAARGWTFVGGVREAEPANGKGLERPGLNHALERVRSGEADCLIVTELARLTRSAAELGKMLDRLGRATMRLVVIDLGIDTGTDSGRLAARALTTVGDWEHERLAERTRKGLAAARARGPAGRPAVTDRPELVEQITRMRARGMTLQAIADALNAQGEPTVRGGARWRPSSVQSALGYKRRPRPSDPTKANGRERKTNTQANGREGRRDD